MKDLYYKVRREPKPGPRGGLSEEPTVWVDFYWKKNWIQTSAATSAVLSLLKLHQDIAYVQFTTHPS